MIDEAPPWTSACLPMEFDADYYRNGHTDLALLSDEALASHFRAWGLREGRAGSAACLREGFLETVVSRVEGALLEIGPFCSPLVKGANVAYLDVFDAEALRARAAAAQIDPSGCPDKIDFVGDLAMVDRRFDAIVGCHSIEHQPDLVRHFRSIADRLTEDGRYLLIVPDKRFSFDVFLSDSNLSTVLQAHREQRTRHTLQAVIEHRAFTTHNDPVRHWRNDHGGEGYGAPARIARAIAEYDDADGGYIDVHAWYFTPDSFRGIVDGLFELGLSSLRTARVYNTPHNRLEFCAILERGR